MSVYISNDIGIDLAGDLLLSSNGDLQLANSLETCKAASNFLLRTDFGDYSPNPAVGCNLGSFIGKLNNNKNHEFIQFNINKILKGQIFSSMDVEATVVPFDVGEVLCVINIGGSYLLDGVIQTVNGETLTYTFPYLEGPALTPITVD